MFDFEKILSSLNPRQREAVETIFGPVLVIAGPGSGKTQLLSARVAHILEVTDYLPYNVLCLTFTDNAAENMRRRLTTMIGADAYKVAIHTFHSFGNEIQNRFRYKFRQYDESKTIDDVMASSILDGILEKLPWNDPYKPGYRASETIRALLSEIQTLKSGGITPAFLRLLIEHNERTITVLTPEVEKYLNRIDALGNKKEEKLQKIQIFSEMTDMVLQMFEKEEKLGAYDTFGKTFFLSLESTLAQYEGDGKIGFISNWKKNWITTDNKGRYILREIEKNERLNSLVNIYETYQAELTARGYIDFADMILRAIELVESDDSVRATLAETYQFIMIDEFQDTNAAQMRLVTAITRANPENPNIFVVGDDDQSIYKFQGANVKNIRDFHDTFDDTKLIILDTNYRSYEDIISISRSILSSDQSVLSLIFPEAQKVFHAARGTGGRVQKCRFQNEVAETAWIVADIEQKIRSGIAPEDIAVIVKKNKSLELIGKSLLEKKIPVSMSKSESIFESDIIHLITQILFYLESIQGPYEQEDNAILLDILAHPAFDIHRLVLWEISKAVYHAKKVSGKSWLEQLRTHADPSLRQIALFFIELQDFARHARLEDLLDRVTGADSLSLPDEYDEENVGQIRLSLDSESVYTSPLYAYFFGSEDNEVLHVEKAIHLANIRKLVDMIRSYKQGKPYLSLSDATELLSLIDTYDIRVEVSHLIGDESHAINCITVHKAKGLEWKHVYVPFLTEAEYKRGKNSRSTLPRNLPLEPDRDEESDINRLVYTAFTRAEDELMVSYSDQNLSEKTSIPLACLVNTGEDWDIVDDASEEGLVNVLEASFHSLTSLPYMGEERDFLRDRIEKQFVMSATALQNFLDITSGGPEQFVSNNILRFPKAKNIAAEYGSAMHTALEDFFVDYGQKGTFIKSLLLESFESSFRDAGFSESKEREYLARGKENLEELYKEIVGKRYGKLEMEYDFRSRFGGVFLGDIQLTGKIDRIEIREDDSLVITDYKTGKGFDSLDGGVSSEYDKVKQWKYRLQLTFYAILFELSPQWRGYTQREYELFFIEKNTKEDKFHRITAYIQQGEIDRMKALIHAVMQHIRECNFPDTSQYPQTLEGVRRFEEDLINGSI